VGRLRAPRPWARRILAMLLPPEDRVAVLEEVDVLYGRRVAESGRARAGVWYAWQVPSFAVRLLLYRLRSGAARRSRATVGGPGFRRFRRGLVRLADAVSRNARNSRRCLGRNPLYVAMSVTTLCVGVAAVSVVDGVANWVLLRPVPGVDDPSGLVTIQFEEAGAQWPYEISDRDYRAVVEHDHLLTGLAATMEQDVHVVRIGGGMPERVRAEVVTGDYFDVLGVRMVAGRGFTAGEANAREAVPVVVLSESLARRYWAAPETAVGSSVALNGGFFTVVGVVGGGFRGETLPGLTELWVPAGGLPSLLHSPDVLREDAIWTRLVGRPVESAVPAAIEAELNALVDLVRREEPGGLWFLGVSMDHISFRVHEGIGLAPTLRAQTTRTLSIIGTCAALLFLLTCANVANLGLGRAASLRAAIAIRRALGAGAAAIVAERLTESVMIGMIASGLGLLLSASAMTLLRGWRSGLLDIPLDGVALDTRVVGFTLLAGIAAGALAGVIPALASGREREWALLRSGRRDTPRTGRIGSGLVVAQVSLSAVLLVGAGLLARTLMNLGHVDLGVRDANVTTFRMSPGLQGYDQAATGALVHRVEIRLRSTPGIDGVAAAEHPPFSPRYTRVSLKLPDQDWEHDRLSVSMSQVTPALFETLGIEILAGRAFRDDEAWSGSGGECLAILNETAAGKLFAGLRPEAAVGRTVMQAQGREDRSCRVVGVARNARLDEPGEPVRPFVFMPWSRGFDYGRFTAYVHTSVPFDQVAADIRRIAADLDPALPVYDLRPWHTEIRSLVTEQRLVAQLALVLAAFGLLLAGVGVYGVLAQAVAGRTREIGIRSALGARPVATMLRIVGNGMAMTLAGVALGLGVGAWLTRFIESRLYGVGHLDAMSYTIGMLVLLPVALVACWLPARRAMRIDPMTVLRED